MLLTMPISIRVRRGIESAQSLYSSVCSGAAADRRLPVVRGTLSRRNGGRPPRGDAQRANQVLDDVLDMLNADAERIVSARTPGRSSSCAVICRCVVGAGWQQSVRVSPIFTSRLRSSSAS
jgi:hypothetical protein